MCLRWDGSCIFYFTSSSLSILFICFSMVVFLLSTESRSSLSSVCICLVLVVALFVGVWRIVFLYILLELTVSLLLALILAYGAQPQKVGACNYLILFRVFRAISLLWVSLGEPSLESGLSQISFPLDFWALV